LVLAAASLLALSATAQAAGLKPGLYDANGQQQICLVNDGTWFSPTFGGWGGFWYNISGSSVAKSGLLGNYSSGAGNDNMNIKKGSLLWTEWRDDLSFTTVIIGTFTRIGDSCGAHAKGLKNKENPAQH
jgi:hypothetical protein